MFWLASQIVNILETQEYQRAWVSFIFPIEHGISFGNMLHIPLVTTFCKCMSGQESFMSRIRSSHAWHPLNGTAKVLCNFSNQRLEFDVLVAQFLSRTADALIHLLTKWRFRKVYHEDFSFYTFLMDKKWRFRKLYHGDFSFYTFAKSYSLLVCVCNVHFWWTDRFIVLVLQITHLNFFSFHFFS